MTSDLLQNREWLIQPDALHAMAATTRAFHDRGGNLPASAPASELLAIEDGIGVVAINGPILRKPGIFSRLFLGATDSEEIGAAIREAGGRPDVKAVFLDIDSPGGTVLGTPELAAAVATLNESKPVYAFSSGLMCSAAYWIASQARAIYATPSAQVGSIGVVQAFLDDSAADRTHGTHGTDRTNPTDPTDPPSAPRPPSRRDAEAMRWRQGCSMFTGKLCPNSPAAASPGWGCGFQVSSVQVSSAEEVCHGDSLPPLDT